MGALLGALSSTQDNWMIQQTQNLAKSTGKLFSKAGERIVRSEARQAIRSGAIAKGLDSLGESIRKGSKKTANRASKIAQKGRNMVRTRNNKFYQKLPNNETNWIKNTNQKLIPANANNNVAARANSNNTPAARANSNNTPAARANSNNTPAARANNNERSTANTVTGLSNQNNLNEELKKLKKTSALPQIAVTSGGSRKKSKKSLS